MDELHADWLNTVSWNQDGLVPAIAQDGQSGKVLMLAWMNREALLQTARSGEVVYWSRSKKRLWRKGETSGNVQKVKTIRLDCDNDAVLLEVEQIGGIACHTGRQHCFFQALQDHRWITVETVIKNPKEMYGE